MLVARFGTGLLLHSFPTLLPRQLREPPLALPDKIGAALDEQTHLWLNLVFQTVERSKMAADASLGSTFRT